jgi:hypothetical protein
MHDPVHVLLRKLNPDIRSNPINIMKNRSYGIIDATPMPIRRSLRNPDADRGAVEDVAHDRLYMSERAFKASTLEGEAILSRMARASA